MKERNIKTSHKTWLKGRVSSPACRSSSSLLHGVTCTDNCLVWCADRSRRGDTEDTPTHMGTSRWVCLSFGLEYMTVNMKMSTRPQTNCGLQHLTLENDWLMVYFSHHKRWHQAEFTHAMFMHVYIVYRWISKYHCAQVAIAMTNQSGEQGGAVTAMASSQYLSLFWRLADFDGETTIWGKLSPYLPCNKALLQLMPKWTKSTPLHQPQPSLINWLCSYFTGFTGLCSEEKAEQIHICRWYIWISRFLVLYTDIAMSVSVNC